MLMKFHTFTTFCMINRAVQKKSQKSLSSVETEGPLTMAVFTLEDD